MKKILLRLSVFALIVTVIVSSASAAFAAEEKLENGIYYYHLLCGTYQEDGSILMKTYSDPASNGQALTTLLKTDSKRRIIIPKGKISIERSLPIQSNTTIIATGVTITQTKWDNMFFRNDPTKLNYASLKNVTIKGGHWIIKDIDKAKRQSSVFRFIHASNIKLIKCTIDSNYISHAVELIACKNVRVDGCKLLSKGKTKADSLEEALQIDIATKATAPSFTGFDKKFLNGQVCKNITVKNCTIKGSRGVCANKTDSEDGKWLGRHHINVRLFNNTITGVTSEAVALHNTAGITMKNNTVISKGSRVDTGYTIGANIASFGCTKLTKSRDIIVENNTIKGGRQGLYIVSYGGATFGTATIKKNDLYSKKGASHAMEVYNCTKVKKSGNKLHKW